MIETPNQSKNSDGTLVVSFALVLAAVIVAFSIFLAGNNIANSTIQVALMLSTLDNGVFMVQTQPQQQAAVVQQQPPEKQAQAQNQQAQAQQQQQAAFDATTLGIPKTSKPVVELFIMSYCPYGLQMQKTYVPVYKLLGSKADMQVKWVAYAMHGLKEVQENTRQYCIQKEQADKYADYATCFVESTDTDSCQTKAKIDKTRLQDCVDATDKTFNTIVDYNNQSTWLSGRYPMYNVQKSDNTKYNVQGSPTLVVNGKMVNIPRTQQAFKQTVCAAFTSPPKECEQTLRDVQEAAGAGAIGTGTGNTGSGGCG